MQVKATNAAVAACSRQPFWLRKSLATMSSAEWESLCDQCGKCCLVVIEREDTGVVYETRIKCTLLDCKTGSCTDYKNRLKRVSECSKIRRPKQGERGTLGWLPETCAYRLLDEGRPLPDWHPLVSGEAATVKDAAPLPKRLVSEDTVDLDADWEKYVVASRAKPVARRLR